jgi:hypothetical protein
MAVCRRRVRSLIALTGVPRVPVADSPVQALSEAGPVPACRPSVGARSHPWGGQYCSDWLIERARSIGGNRGSKMDKRAVIDKFVRQHNIERYRKLLGKPLDPMRRQQLQMLLAELAELDEPTPPPKRQ